MGRLLDEDKVIDAIKNCECMHIFELSEVIPKINALPPAQPEPQWIPCSERLPDKPNMYTVTDHNGKVVRYVFYDNESSREYWRRCAKAWMPLPSPYQESEQDG